jgi:hypothetical protein
LLLILSLAASASTTAIWIRSRHMSDVLSHGSFTARSRIHWRIESASGALCWWREAMYMDADTFSQQQAGFSFESDPAGYGYNYNGAISFRFYPTRNRSSHTWSHGGFEFFYDDDTIVNRFTGGSMGHVVETSVNLPDWSFVTLFLMTAGLSGVAILGRRHPAGFCQNCGYDMRASADRCPECGKTGMGDKSNGQYR